jgi:hypothetical protein
MSKQKKRLGRKAQRYQDFASALTPLTEAFATSRGVNRDSLPTQQAARNLANIQNEKRQDQRRLDFLRSTNELNEEFQQRELDRNIERFESRFGGQDSAQPQPTLFSRPRGRVLDVTQEPTQGPLRMIDGEEAEVDSSFLPPSVAEVGSYPAFDISDAQGQKNYIDAERDNLRYIKRQQLTDEGVKQVQVREQALAAIEQNRPGQQSEALSQYQDYVSKSSLMDEVVKTPTIDEEIQNGVNIRVTEDGTFLRKPDGTYSANYKPQALQQQMTGDLIRSQTELKKQANDNEAKNRQSTTDNIKELYGSVANFRKEVSSRVEQELKNAGLTRSQVSQESLDEVSRQVEQGLVQEANASTLTGSSEEESLSGVVSPKEVDEIASAYGLDLSIPEDEEKLARIASQLYPDKEYVSLAGLSGGDASSQVISEMRPEDAYIKFNEGEDTSDNGASYARRTDQTLRMFHPMISIGDIYARLDSQIKQMSEGTEDPVATAKKMRYAVDPFVITRLDLQRATPDPKTGKRPSDKDGLQAIEIYMKAYNKHREGGQHIGYLIPITRSAMLERGLYISGDKERDLEMIRSIPVGQKYFDTDGTIYTKKMKKPLIPKPKGPPRSSGSYNLGIGTMGM